MTKIGRQFFSGKNRGDIISCRPMPSTLVTPLLVSKENNIWNLKKKRIRWRFCVFPKFDSLTACIVQSLSLRNWGNYFTAIKNEQEKLWNHQAGAVLQASYQSIKDKVLEIESDTSPIGLSRSPMRRNLATDFRCKYSLRCVYNLKQTREALMTGRCSLKIQYSSVSTYIFREMGRLFRSLKWNGKCVKTLITWFC